MAKYLFTNWETIPFKKKSFEGQLDRYAKVCVSSVENPHKVLFILPLFGKECGAGYGHIIEIVRNHELRKDNDLEFSKLLKPFDGEFVEIPSKHGPLFRIFTKDEAKYGICPKDKIGKAERDETGKVKIYHTIKVFCLYENNIIIGKQYINGWYPEDWYYRFFGYNYRVLSDLTEPEQI